MTITRTPDLVSIVVTCYNTSRYVKACLESLVRQSYQTIEIIVVDDASRDSTIATVKRFFRTRKYRGYAKRVKLVRLPSNVGYAGAITTGLFLTSGEFIAIQDADDISHHERIQKQVQFLKERPDHGLVGTNYASFPSGNFHKQQVADWIKYGDEIYNVYQNGGHCVCHGSILFRGEIFDRLGGPTRRIKGAEDYEFIAKCINDGVKIDNLPDVLYYYRQHSTQRSNKIYG